VAIEVPARPEEIEGIDGSRCWRSVLRVPMRDGVDLITDRYTAEQEPRNPRPVVLERRTPYGRRIPRQSERLRGRDDALTPAEIAAYFVDRGYTVVMQDCRGRGA
jgi:uncharacterized protein